MLLTIVVKGHCGGTSVKKMRMQPSLILGDANCLQKSPPLTSIMEEYVGRVPESDYEEAKQEGCQKEEQCTRDSSFVPPETISLL